VLYGDIDEIQIEIVGEAYRVRLNFSRTWTIKIKIRDLFYLSN
jgi:hypothetical protein